MKTKLTTIFKKSANTPPMWVCLLFALIISTNCWATVVTAEWGDYTTPATGFPYGTHQEINGIKITPCATLASDPNVFIDGHSCHNYQLNTTGKYFDITLSSGYITQVKCNVWTANNTLLKIQFSKKSPYDSNDLTGDPIPLHDANRDAPTSMLTVNAPSDAKSARIYKDGSDHWQCYLYRLIVTASTGCDSPETASFAASGVGISGSAPSNINACAGGEFIIPNAGTLAKSGYDFVGWNDGSTTKSPGDSYIMPADGVTFTAEWNPHYVPAVTDLNSSVSGDDVTITWTNYNKLNTPSVSFADAALNNYSTTNGTLSCNYTHAGGWAGPCLELSLPRSMNHVTSIDMEYYHTNSANSSGGIITYLKSGVEDAKGKWFDNSDDAHTYLTKTAEYTDIQIVPRAILWSTTSNAYSSDYHIGILGFACNLASESTGTFSIKDIYINTSDNQTTLDEIKIIRKKGSAPSSISDGTQVYSGVLNTFTDENVEDGLYYYAVYAREGEAYSAAVVEGPIQIGTPKADPELTASVDKGAISTTGSAQLTVNKANAYDGTIEYSVSPSGVISLNETTGEITAVAAGTATITVNAPATSGYYSDNKSVTVAVIAAPETNLAITNVDGDNVTLTWDVPGKIDLSTATLSNNSYFIISQKPADSKSYDEVKDELTVTYTAGQWAQEGIALPFILSDLEYITYEYKGHRVFPAIISESSKLYWEYDVVESADNWTKVTRTPINDYQSEDIANPLPEAKAITFCANPNVAKTDESFYLRNVFYHCTGMTDIDHIVIMRTTGAAATDTVSGTKIYSGKMSHFVDTDSKAAGLYYYTLFAVYENGSIPVESVTLDTRVFNITYKDKGDAEFSGTHETGYPTTHSNAAATALKKATKEDYIFAGWFDNSACTGNPISTLKAGDYDADITLYARWEQLSLHQPGKYQAPDGYGRVLKNINSHDYEVYMVTFDTVETEYYGALYAGPIAKISDGYRMFRTSSNINTTSTSLGDGWTEFKPYKYGGGDGSGSIDEFKKLDGSGNIHSARYARLSSDHYVRLYVQGYVEFALCCKDKKTDGTDNIVIRIDGVTQAYAPSTSMQVVRYTLTSNEPHFIEITGNSSESKEDNVYGFSLQLPDVERYTVTVTKNDNSHGTVSAASIANVRRGEATYISDNTVYIAGTTVTATPAENTAEYTYAFDNWSGVPATITEATTVTANFTRTGNDYTLTWNLNGGTVTTAGTGAAVDATGTPSSSVAYGTAITVPVVEKDGYEFIGWDATPAATMPAENTTYTAQWATPTVIGSGTTTLDYSNVYLPTAPATYEINVDGVEGDETCLDIKDRGQADWWVKMTPGSYRVAVKYGTPSGCVKVRVQVIDKETGTQVAQTEIDEHCSGTVFMAAWAMDLGELIDANKTYYIRVKDAYESTGSKPKVGIVEITPIEPLPITTAATKRLDYDNVAVPYQIMPFDIENDGVNETCLFIGNQHQADWKVTIVPDVYNIKIKYGKPSAGTNLTLYLLDEDGGEVWKSAARTTPSDRYETWKIKGVDLTNEVNKDKVYTIRIKDTYGSDGSKPYIEYIDVIPAVVRIPSETRLDATNTYSSVNIATDVDFDDDSQTSDESMNLNGTQADWSVQIQPGYYNVSLAYGAPEYSVKVAVTLTDPSGEKSEIYLSTNPYYSQSGSEGEPHHHISSTKCDLTDLDKNKTYRLHITDQYGSSNKLRVSHLVFTPIEPVLITNGTILNSGNTVTFNAPTQEFNVDGEDGNETCLLVSQHYGVSPVEWSVNVTPGVYDLNVHFGNDAPNDGGYDMTIYLVDPEAPETPVSLYHKRVNDGTSLSYGVARCDFSGLVADKDYIIRVVDNWDGSKLRVGDIKFVTPEPLQIPEVTRLNASNVYVLPKYGKENFNIEGEGEIECLNIRYQGEAAWFANLTPYVYDITLKYGKPEASVKVLFGIIDVESGETVFSRQFDNSEEGAQTYTQNFTIDLRNDITAGKLYKLFIKDNYGSNGSEPRVAYIDIARYTITYTRTGLTVGNYGTICLPYAVAAEDIHGADIFDMQGWPAGSVAVVLNEVDNMEAGRPYVIQAKATTATWSYYPEGDPAAAGSHNGLIGSYDKEVIPANANNYMVYKNKLYYVDVLSYVGANKAYINRTEAEAAAEPVAPAPGKRQIRLFLDGEQVITDIDQINDQMTNTKYMENGILYILREGKVYNAQGQLVK